MLEHLRLLSRYNQWMNDKLYNIAAQLPADEIATDRGAFFGSLLGALNHIMVADVIWLQRFSEHPALNQIRAMEQTAISGVSPARGLYRIKCRTSALGRYDHILVRAARRIRS